MDEAVPEQPMILPPALLLSPEAAMSPETIERSVRPMPAPTTPEYMDFSDCRFDNGGIGPVLGPPQPSSLSPLPSSLPATPLDGLAPGSSSHPALIRSRSSSGLDKPSSPESIIEQRALGTRINTADIDSQETVSKLLDELAPDSVYGWLDDLIITRGASFLDMDSDMDSQEMFDVGMQTRSPRQDTKSDQQNYLEELRRSDSELPYHTDDQILSLQPLPLPPRPELQEFFKEDTNQVTHFNDLRGSDSDVSYHPDGQILSLQALPLRPALQVLFKLKQGNTASNSDFRSIGDYGSQQTSNPFAPTDLVISSTSHHVPNSLESILHGHSSTPLAIPYHHLQKITDHFSDDRILGQGGSGVVYKGVLQNGETIAVKKIVSSLMPGLQKKFENEVYHLMMLKHPNIVRCVGYCYETQHECLEYNGKLVFAEKAERLLCLEYIPKRSLDKYITDESSGLDWRTRYKIIEGICYGLCHLHVENGKPIIHLDLKPANILLDNGMVSKITDFGLSRLLDQQKTIYTKSRDGTLGYMAPEFLHGGTITPKSDIFSLGVIIIEVVTGNRDYPDVTRTSSDGFMKLVLNKWRNVLEKSSWFGSLERDCQQIERCIQVGLICVNPDRTKRPPIANIINMLQGSESINRDKVNQQAMLVW